MIGFIIWIIGVVLTIKAAIEIWNLNVDPVKKIVVIVLLVLTSWLGIAVYCLLPGSEGQARHLAEVVEAFQVAL